MILQGRGVNAGSSRGEALVSGLPLSFLGGLDPATGNFVDPGSDLAGRSVAGKVLVFPMGKGSTVGSYVLYGACRRGNGPAAILCERAETIVAVGAVISGIPLIDRVDLGAVQTGDRVSVDGATGTVHLPGVRQEEVASAFLRRGDHFLFLHRGETAPTHPGLWSGVSGMIEGSEDPAARAQQEIAEETGLTAKHLAQGKPIFVRLGARAFRIHPFLFDCLDGEPRLNYENDEARWLTMEEIRAMPCVPRLADAIGSAVGGLATRP